MTTATMPFRCVTSADSGPTHLVAASPALPGTGPDLMPSATLCGVPAVAESPQHPSAVDCVRCLARVPQFMALPAYEVLP